MKLIKFPAPFQHKHPPIQNVNELLAEKGTTGQRSADWVARNIGSWKFIIIQSILLTFWVILNVTAFIYPQRPHAGQPALQQSGRSADVR